MLTRPATMRILAFMLCVISVSAAASDVAWPKLSKVGHVAGRAATDADLAKGNAVFVLKSDGAQVGKPIKVQIPQYAMHVEAKTGKKTPVVLVQAEEGQGIRMAGYVSVRDGEKAVCLLSELKLLGTAVPK